MNPPNPQSGLGHGQNKHFLEYAIELAILCEINKILLAVPLHDFLSVSSLYPSLQSHSKDPCLLLHS